MASGQAQPCTAANNPPLNTLMVPFSFMASDIMTRGANQMSASHARCSSSRSSQSITRANSRAHRPESATKVFDTPCRGEVTQPVMTANMMATSHFSARFMGPRRASSTRAMARASGGVGAADRPSRNSSHGTMASVSNPGTMDAASQRPQVRSTCPILRANSAISGLAAMPVRNMADAGYVVWNDTNIRNEPILPAVGPGSDPKALATERVTGYTTPPPRAVSEGMKGARTRSAAASE